MSTATDALDKEIKAFEDQIDELEKHHNGKFALFKDGKLVETYTSEQEAYEEGIKQFGNDVFLVRRVTRQLDAASAPALFAGVVNANS